MRLPISRVYRAFPELDRFPDHVCERYVAQARYKAWRSKIAVALLAMLSVPVMFLVTLFLLMQVGELFHKNAIRSSTSIWPVLIVLVLSTAAAILTPLCIRDRWLIWAVRKQIGGTGCPRCGYQLIGLTIDNGRVRCPECGFTESLVNLNLTPADLLAPGESAVPAPPASRPVSEPVGSPASTPVSESA